jgi:hypothetical protein
MPTLTLTPLALLDDPECLPVDCAFDAQTLHDVLRGLVLSRRESVTRQVASMRCMSGELHDSERSMRAADARARAAEAKAKEAVARAAMPAHETPTRSPSTPALKQQVNGPRTPPTP